MTMGRKLGSDRREDTARNLLRLVRLVEGLAKARRMAMEELLRSTGADARPERKILQQTEKTADSTLGGSQDSNWIL